MIKKCTKSINFRYHLFLIINNQNKQTIVKLCEFALLFHFHNQHKSYSSYISKP